MQIDPFCEQTWRFIRGDLPPREFESWVFWQPGAEPLLGSELYLVAISTDYTSEAAIAELRSRLADFVRNRWVLPCRCLELPNLAIVDMGEKVDEVLRHFERIASRGPERWWLSAERCRECGQAWLVASEERQNDVLCLLRMSPAQVANLVEKNDWPPDFDAYEALLRIGLAAGCRVSFWAPLSARSLRDTMEDLARARPGIRVSELAGLLNLDRATAERLARRIVTDEEVEIDFD